MSTEQKFWTFEQAFEKVRADTDIDEEDPDETFMTLEEFIGHFNEGIDEAERKIHKDIDEDYFLTRDSLLMVEGESEYPMPDNIFADKIRNVRFKSGTERYQVTKIRRKDLFARIEELEDSDNADAPYQHYIRNDTPGSRKFVLLPPARETATIAPMSPVSAPITRWYLRNANRIPLPGEFTNAENLLPAAFNVETGAITVDPEFPYVTGDEVRFSLKSSAFILPEGLEEDTSYYVVRLSDTRIKLATSLALARSASRGLVSGDRIQEEPTGTINGTTGSDGNATFTLSETPYSDASVQVYVGGTFMRQGTHYTIADDTITFLAPYIPVVNDEIDVTYYPESDEPTTNPTEVQEVPSGTINGANVTFTLSETPSSAAAVSLYLNGNLVEQGEDYEISGRTITFYTAPAALDTLDAVYDTAVFFFGDDGTGFFTMKVAATREIIDATILDIPEFADFVMEWVKARVMFKDADPRLQLAVQIAEAKGKDLVEVLSDREPDDDNTVEADFSHYEEMN